MAAPNLSPALRAPASSRAHPKAKPGYGKRSVSRQRHDGGGDFTLLPERERHIAGYVDALPEGAAMDIKSLARSQPLYGQMAVGSALRALGVAGHLRHVRCLSGEGDQVRWVTRTFWSRTAHDNEWWTAFLAAEEHHRTPQEPTEKVVPAPGEAPEPEPAPAPVPVPAQPPPWRYRSSALRSRSPGRGLLPPSPPWPASAVPTPAWPSRQRTARHWNRRPPSGWRAVWAPTT